MNSPRFFLLLSAAGLVVIALGYGAAPAEILPRLFDVTVESTDTTHVFRGVMGLYLAMATLWVLGALRPGLTRAAVTVEVAFMFGLAFGRVLSILVDGMPSPVFVVYLGLEIVFGVWGSVILTRLDAARLAEP